jgi:hypothetical protein
MSVPWKFAAGAEESPRAVNSKKPPVVLAADAAGVDRSGPAAQ